MKIYSITIQHDELETTTHNFKSLCALDIFSNIIDSKTFVPVYGLDSYYDLAQQINKLFFYYPDSHSEWEWVLNVADYDYLTAWEKFSHAIEQDERGYQPDWEVKSNEQHLAYVPF
jgi:hypothetical protein